MERNVFFDNVKGFLIFLVVLGHVLEKYYMQNSFLYVLWVGIYSFHMPLFIYVSGYFSKNIQKTQEHSFTRFLLPYFIWNTGIFAFRHFYFHTGSIYLLYAAVPYWYFLSVFTMILVLPVLTRIHYNIILAFGATLVLGFREEVGDFLSLSRTIYLLGFFLLGFYSNDIVFKFLRKQKIKILIAAGLAIFAFVWFVVMRFGLSEIIPPHLCYNTHYRYGKWLGLFIRVISIFAALLFGGLTLSWMTEKKCFLTKIGKNTLVIFVFHIYFVANILNPYLHVDPTTVLGCLSLILISMLLTFVLSTDVLNRAYNNLMNRIANVFLKEDRKS
jgi:fucose 4-O-acetylase-like acetyltransferase